MSSTGIGPPFVRVNSGKDWASWSVWKMVNTSRDGCWRTRKIEYPSKKQFDGLVFWEVGRKESPFKWWVGVGFCSPHDLWWQCDSAWWEYCLCWVRFRNHSIRRWGTFSGLWYLDDRYLEGSWTRQNDSSLVYFVPYYCCHDEFASWKLVPSVRLQMICVWKDCGSVCWSNVPAGLRWGQV